MKNLCIIKCRGQPFRIFVVFLFFTFKSQKTFSIIN